MNTETNVAAPAASVSNTNQVPAGMSRLDAIQSGKIDIMPKVAAPIEKAIPADVGVKDEPKKSDKPAEKPASKATSSKEEVAEIKKLKLKINGQEQEFDESEIVKKVQMGESAYKKFEEAAAERKKVEAFKKGLKSNFVDTINKMGPELGMKPAEIRQMVEDYLVDQIKQESMTPQDRQRYEMEQELKALKEKEALTQQQEEAKQLMQLQEKYAEEYDRNFTESLKKMNIPKTPFTVARMATYMSQALENGYDLDPMDAAKLVHEDYKNDIKSTFADMDGEQILALIGESNAKKIRSHDVSKLQNRYVKATHNDAQPQTSMPKKEKNWSSWQERLDKLEKGEIEL